MTMRLLTLLLFLITTVTSFAQNEIRNTLLLMIDKEYPVEMITKNEEGLVDVKLLVPSMNIYRFQFDHELSEETKRRFFLADGVIIVQYDHSFEWRDTIPNDSLFGEQWSLMNTGQGGATEDADIDAELAWEKTTGGINLSGDTLVVAVVDGAFALDHPDMNYWKNRDEIPNNGIDDDENGYVDDYDGWNAYNSNGDMSATSNHGAHVSGIVGAIGNNEEGIAGINWNVQVMPVRGSTTSESTALEAYGYLYQQRKLYNETNGEKGALIVASNSSFGINQGNPDNYPLWCAFYDSLGSVGILNAVAVPNADWDIDVIGDIPGTCVSDYTLSVTNSNSDDERNSAGYGLVHVDLAAPGTNIKSTIPQNFGGNWYNNSTGTSMASPHVAGAVAYVLSGACDSLWSLYEENPAETSLLIKDFILNGVDTLGHFEGESVTGGRLNLNGAYARMQYHCDWVIGISENEEYQEFLWTVSPNPTTDYLTINLNTAQNFNASWQIVNSLGQVVNQSNDRNYYTGNHQFSVNVGGLEPGVYYLKWSTGSVKRFIVL